MYLSMHRIVDMIKVVRIVPLILVSMVVIMTGGAQLAQATNESSYQDEFKMGFDGGPTAPLSNLKEQKAQNLLDALNLLGRSPLYIHKLQLQLSLDSRYYTDIQNDCSKYNKAKQHEEKIGTSIVKYLFYPNGKTMIFVACSNNPFKLEDDADESILYSFLGQVRDRLLYLVTDPHERIVPPITKWILTGCDINKDIAVADMLQLSAINIQLKDAGRVFRLYIKSLGDKAVYRVEESVMMRSALVDVLHSITSPSEPQTLR
jgi:hypothetical protein